MRQSISTLPVIFFYEILCRSKFLGRTSPRCCSRCPYVSRHQICSHFDVSQLSLTLSLSMYPVSRHQICSHFDVSQLSLTLSLSMYPVSRHQICSHFDVVSAVTNTFTIYVSCISTPNMFSFCIIILPTHHLIFAHIKGRVHQFFQCNNIK